METYMNIEYNFEKQGFFKGKVFTGL